MSKGLEALDKLMESFYELCEDCNCNEDMYQKYNLTSPHHIVRKELERLEKLARVVDILKEYTRLPPLEEFSYDEFTNCYFAEVEEDYYNCGELETEIIHYVLEKEQYELLKELI